MISVSEIKSWSVSEYWISAEKPISIFLIFHHQSRHVITNLEISWIKVEMILFWAILLSNGQNYVSWGSRKILWTLEVLCIYQKYILHHLVQMRHMILSEKHWDVFVSAHWDLNRPMRLGPPSEQFCLEKCLCNSNLHLQTHNKPAWPRLKGKRENRREPKHKEETSHQQSQGWGGSVCVCVCVCVCAQQQAQIEPQMS